MLRGSCILVVEDEPTIAHDIQRTLVRLGYHAPLTVATGPEAIHAAKSMQPKLVLMDIDLQGPMDGIAAATTIREECAIPFVYLTSHSDDAIMSRAMLVSACG